MAVPENRKWMDARLDGRKHLTEEFVVGVHEFIKHACEHDQFHVGGGKIRCPCKKCKCIRFEEIDMVKVHLCMKGFMMNYYHWTNHGEPIPGIPPPVVDHSYYGNSRQREMYSNYFTADYERDIVVRDSQENLEGANKKSDNDIYLKVVGGVNKKRRIYGSGTEAEKYKRATTIGGFSLSEHETMRHLVSKLLDENAMLKDQMKTYDDKFDFMQRLIMERTSHCTSTSVDPPTNQQNQNDDDDDNEFED